MNQDYLVEKWLNDALTPEELRAFEASADYQQYKDILDAAQCFKAANFSEVQDFSTFKAAYQGESTARSNQWLKPLLRIAAVFVVGLGLYFSFFNNPSNHFSTAATETVEVMLPDNSEVTLNALSTLTYKSRNWDSNRNLELQGEAYFKVAKGSVFTVHTETGKVTVVGTQFNVKNRADFFEVICYEGQVRVQIDQNDQLLSAGQVVRSLAGKISTTETSDLIPGWLSNRSDFKAVPFAEVLAELQRQFGVTVEVNDSVDLQRVFSGSFTHENLDTALTEITKPMDLTFERNGMTVIIDVKKN